MKRQAVLILLLFTTNLFLFSQEKVNPGAFHKQLKAQEEKILIKGASNINKWESLVGHADAKLILHSSNKINNFQRINDASTLIDTLFIKIKVTDIKSGKKKMDRITHKALKSSEYPYIIFSYETNNNTFLTSQTISGKLTVAGITKKITTQIIFNKEPSSLTLKGIHRIDMTAFGVKPPSLFLGLIKAKKEIDVDFTLRFVSSF